MIGDVLGSSQHERLLLATALKLMSGKYELYSPAALISETVSLAAMATDAPEGPSSMKSNISSECVVKTFGIPDNYMVYNGRHLCIITELLGEKIHFHIAGRTISGSNWPNLRVPQTYANAQTSSQLTYSSRIRMMLSPLGHLWVPLIAQSGRLPMDDLSCSTDLVPFLFRCRMQVDVKSWSMSELIGHFTGLLQALPCEQRLISRILAAWCTKCDPVDIVMPFTSPAIRPTAGKPQES
ncbi:hypothetical protein PILCRDRAFT_819270 [Piloderma croceum F 1598]|uniref:Uncharacterized protein n=1 Tax=Piloderma croceum (strain F 1598) TaxID=765440 RepID=A0A0C3FH24_PILCF|nr:hypothetical protein PILCRDRAFT_819270 [Piloderma croceum F 1598]